MPMNIKEDSPQGARSASEHSQFSLVTPSTSPQAACTRCSVTEVNEVVTHSGSANVLDDRSGNNPDIESDSSDCYPRQRSHAGKRPRSTRVGTAAACKDDPPALPEGLVQFLMAQNEHLAERLSKAETMLESAQDHAEADDASDDPELVAESEDGDDKRWEAVQFAMNVRQQAEESLKEDCRQLRDGLCRLLLIVISSKVHPDNEQAMATLLQEFIPFPPAPLLLPQPDSQPEPEIIWDEIFGKTTKREKMKKAMRDVNAGLRIVVKVCTVICLLVGVVALSRLPGQHLRLMDRKLSGVGVWIRW